MIHDKEYLQEIKMNLLIEPQESEDKECGK